MSIKDQVSLVRDSLKDYPHVQVIAATKYMDIAQTQELIDAGICDFGENRTDEFLIKYEHFKNNKNIRWHYFGVVQSRKIKDLANRIVCLHSLERLSTAIELNKKLNQPLDCFVQINICDDPKKQGIPANKVKTFINQLESCKKINIIGLMCIAPFTFDETVIRKAFLKMKKIKEEIENLNIPYAPCHELSMGMSNDYKIALQYGATKVRLGRIFLI